MDELICAAVCRRAGWVLMLLLRLLKKARRYYPYLPWYDLLIAALEELIEQNKLRAYKRPDVIHWKDFWFTKWTTPDGMDDYLPSLPAMYTVWHKGTPVMDTAAPKEWIQKQIDQNSR